VGGIIYSTHTLEPLKDLSLDSQRAQKLASKPTRILSLTLLILSIPSVPFPVPSPALIKSLFQANPATLLILIDHFFGDCVFFTLGHKMAIKCCCSYKQGTENRNL
jgi:hypothetical protein